MIGNEFDNKFQHLTNFKPLNWQRRLYAEHFMLGTLPAAVDIPTGLGKTSVMAIWYLALKEGARLPRRLIYVVDRRAVVDQASTVAQEIKTRSGDAGLRISTLRGQQVDNRVWLEDPAAIAIIVGTVDMIGSRLLFSGYGVSRKMRPYHAGLLGADTLVVLDESHLVPPFERLLEAIETRDEFGAHNKADRSFV
ncbi:MAG: DEAD/DEAH box helicase family protein, partial [Anaerolineae bacterium]|nr:DEAD/DEAH box helicase family protein [Anaerolineae bacterium]